MHCSYQYSTAYTVKIHSIAKCTKMLRCVINLRPTDGIGYSECCTVDACFMQGSTTAGTLALVFATQISGFFAGSSKTRNATFVVSCALPIAEICLHRESACTVSFSSAWSDWRHSMSQETDHCRATGVLLHTWCIDLIKWIMWMFVKWFFFFMFSISQCTLSGMWQPTFSTLLHAMWFYCYCIRSCYDIHKVMKRMVHKNFANCRAVWQYILRYGCHTTKIY